MFEIETTPTFNNLILQKNASELKEILLLNETTRRFGLSLTKEQAISLIENRNIALKDTGRIEIGEGILETLIYAFCDSPYMYNGDYLETLEELTNTFYLYRNEFDYKITDEQIIRYLRNRFDVPCEGSVELLAGAEFENLRKRLGGY